ncbi:muscle-specific protein 300 kDa-like isoform X2 [Macrobrachium rosenbergii]|uniref:muscle-specific protein 300 kDa-like isoform X2 n=1 Tax=Macrobrachium rosenbergii TaxID=79674 RepID=UPI0034D48F0B
MTFWQENYGFVKEVYDFRCSKYLEWMDNIEAIIGKVMANTQYTAKEFKIIKDTFTSLCRDLEKEGTKSWLDMMLEKLSQHSSEGEEGLSGRDKAMKAQEKKKLEAMVERHKGLMGPTMEAQSKVDHYSECYAFGDDIHPVMKVLNEQRHLSMKEIHPHNMDMCEEQIDKQEKVLRTIENQAPIYNELMKRGAKLKANPNAPSFLEREIAKLEETWKDTNEKAQLRIDLLNSTYKDWDVYEQQRQAIYAPLDSLEDQFKTYKRIYDPKKGTDWLERKKKKAEEQKKIALEIYEVIKRCFATIVALAGEDKREFMEKEIVEIDEKRTIIEKIDKMLVELTEFNGKLHKFVNTLAELRAWMMPACEKLDFITTSTDLSPEDRVKEIFDLQGQVNERLPLLEPLEAECHDLLDGKNKGRRPDQRDGPRPHEGILHHQGDHQRTPREGGNRSGFHHAGPEVLRRIPLRRQELQALDGRSRDRCQDGPRQAREARRRRCPPDECEGFRDQMPGKQEQAGRCCRIQVEDGETDEGRQRGRDPERAMGHCEEDSRRTCYQDNGTGRNLVRAAEGD